MLPSVAERMDDTDLMVRYRNGDLAAFETLYSYHKGPLYRYFLRQGLQGEKAAELFQEVWTKIIKARHRYEPTAKFTTYMYQLAHNTLVDHRRRQSRRPQHATSDAVIDPIDVATASADGPESGVQSMQVVDKIRRALAALPFEQKEAFLLREEGGMNLSEIARATGVSTETAKSRLRYAVVKLRQIIGSESELE